MRPLSQSEIGVSLGCHRQFDIERFYSGAASSALGQQSVYALFWD